MIMYGHGGYKQQPGGGVPLDMGANDYITKPVDFTVALARIRAQLSRKHAETARSRERRTVRPGRTRGQRRRLWDWDLTSNKVYYSARWKSMAGLTDAEVGDSPDDWFSRIHADDAVAVRAAIQHHLESQSEGFEVDYRIKQRDGCYRWMDRRARHWL